MIRDYRRMGVTASVVLAGLGGLAALVSGCDDRAPISLDAPRDAGSPPDDGVGDVYLAPPCYDTDCNGGGVGEQACFYDGAIGGKRCMLPPTESNYGSCEAGADMLRNLCSSYLSPTAIDAIVADCNDVRPDLGEYPFPRVFFDCAYDACNNGSGIPAAPNLQGCQDNYL